MIKKPHAAKKLLSTSLFALIIIIIAASVTLAWINDQKLKQVYIQSGFDTAQSLTNQTAAILVHGPTTQINKSFAQLNQQVGIENFTVYDKYCKVLYQKQAQANHTQSTCKVNKLSLQENAENWHYAAPVILGTTASPTGYVQTIISKGNFALAQNNLWLTTIAIGLLIIFSVVILIIYFSRTILSPLTKLAFAINTSTNASSGMQVTPNGTKEMHEIANAFNTILNALKQKNSTLKHTEKKVVESSKSEVELARNIQHAIHTSMHGMLGLLTLLKDMKLTEEQQEYISLANQSAEQLFTLVKDILIYSSISDGSLQLEYQKFELRPLLEDCIEQVDNDNTNEAIEPITNIDPDLPIELEGDSTKLKQIIIGLLSTLVTEVNKGFIKLSCDLIKDESDSVTLRFTIQTLTPEVREKSCNAKYNPSNLKYTLSEKLVHCLDGTLTTDVIDNDKQIILQLPLTKPTESTKHKQLPPWGGMKTLIVAPKGIYQKMLTDLCDHQMLEYDVIDDIKEIYHHLNNNPETNYNLIFINWPNPLTDELTELEYNLKTSTPNIKTVNFVRKNSKENYPTGVAATVERPYKEQLICEVLAKILNKKTWKAAEVYECKLTTAENEKKQKSKTIEQPQASHSKETPPTLELTKDIDVNTPNSQIKILVVEDNITNQVVVTAALKRMGITPDITENGAEGIEAYKAKDYSLIIMDIQMPIMNGFEATQKIRAIESATNKHVPIIALTANVASSDAGKCLDYGMDDFLAKPFRLQHLESMLESWLGDAFTPMLEETHRINEI